MSPRVRWRVHDRDGFIVLQLIARSTNVRQVLALRRIDQRVASRIDVSVDRHIGVIEPDRKQISAHDPVDDCARLHQFNELRPDLSLKLFMGKSSAPRSQIFHWTLGALRAICRRWTLAARAASHLSPIAFFSHFTNATSPEASTVATGNSRP